MKKTAIIFQNYQAPGDILMLSAAIRDLHRCYPNKFITGIETTAREVWENNPYLVNLSPRRVRILRVGYPLIHRSNQCGLHFIQGFIDDINKKLNLKIRLTEFRPDIHWSKGELCKPLIEGDYWVIISGGKADFTTKWWDPERYQEVVDRLSDKIKFVQIGGKPAGGGARHYHPPLNNVINLVGKTNLREAFRIVLHAKGIITPVTCFMHLAAAVGIPAIVIAGGREHYTWEAYTDETFHRNMAYAAGLIKRLPGTKKDWYSWSPEKDKHFVPHKFVPHNFFHSIGKLICCRSGGCWKTKVVEGNPNQNCVDVVKRPGKVPLPRCLDLISVDMVVNAILDHLDKEKISNNVKINLKNAAEPPPRQDKNPVLEKLHVMTTHRSKGSTVETPSEAIPPSQLRFKHLQFPVTVCVLTYGDHGNLALRCLKSIYKYFDPSLFKLRFAMNEPSKQARKMIMSFLEDKPNVEKIYEATPQIYKYPMMRRMFHDKEKPIDTKWIMWMDDDSHIASRNWILEVGNKIDETFLIQTTKYPKGYHMFGKVYYFHLRGNQWDWMKKASWYTGRPLNKDYTKNPPMDKSDFCTGGFWLVTTEAVMAADWPDPRLKHRGGDIWMGVALQQQGYGVMQAYKGVKISDAPKRGYDETIAGIK